MLQRFFDPARELGQALIEVRPALRRTAVFSFVLNLLYLAPSVYMLQVYDRVLTSRNITTLLMLTLMLVVAYVVFGIMDRVRAQMLLRVGVRLDQQLSQRVFTAATERILRGTPGNPAQSLGDLTQVRQFVAGTGALAFFDTPWLPVYLLVIGLVHPYLLVFACVVVVILFGVTWLNEWRTHKPITEANREASANTAFLHGNVRHVDAITALGMAGALRKRWADRQAKVLAWQTVASEEGARLGAWSKTLRLLFQSLALGLGAWLAVDNQITAGSMVACSILLGRALAPAEQLLVAWKQWIGANEAWKRLDDLLQAHPAPPPRLQLPAPTGALALEDVHAAAPAGKKPIIQGLSLRIEPGDVVLVGGPSGCGKSTLAKLLLGVWLPTRGTVRLDGADVANWDKEHLGPYVGYLPQEVALLQGSVAENIARFGALDSQAVVEAAQAAGVHDMVLRLPEGYDTVLGPDGAGLSGGQRQRIALARALYGRPRLVVLDEPNASLDPAGEAALLQAIRQLKAAGSTVILIAHGQSLLQAADKMLILNEGKLVVYGPRDKVLAHLAGPGAKPAVPAVQGVAA